MDDNNATPNAISTPMAAAAIVISALAFLILVRRGFRGVSVGGVSVGVN